jgi:hypothetical protein
MVALAVLVAAVVAVTVEHLSEQAGLQALQGKAVLVVMDLIYFHQRLTTLLVAVVVDLQPLE